MTNMPHTGQENTWWNIENGPYHDIEGEFFTYGLYAYSNYKGPYREEDFVPPVSVRCLSVFLMTIRRFG
ncbi:MAG: hypothetical protein IPM37_07345 [Hahellaceae bacterium]|nr:hypothetical protein [Hahellaceae bacterium]